MNRYPGPRLKLLHLSALLALVLLVACAEAEPALPTLAPTAEAPPSPVPPEPTLPPPRIIAVPVAEPRSAAIQLPSGSASSQVIIHSGQAGGAVPPEVQRLLDELAEGKILLNASPAGPDGQSVSYAYRDINGDGVRDLVVIVVAEPGDAAGQLPDESADEPVQAIGINVDALVQSLNQNPGAPLIDSAFVYSVSAEELDQLGNQ